jgi:hypothetical protein
VFLYIVFITGVKCFLIYLDLKKTKYEYNPANYVRSFTECILHIILLDARSNESAREGYLAFLRKADVDTKCWFGVTWEASN